MTSSTPKKNFKNISRWRQSSSLLALRLSVMLLSAICYQIVPLGKVGTRPGTLPQLFSTSTGEQWVMIENLLRAVTTIDRQKTSSYHAKTNLEIRPIVSFWIAASFGESIKIQSFAPSYLHQRPITTAQPSLRTLNVKKAQTTRYSSCRETFFSGGFMSSHAIPRRYTSRLLR
jgi:hypothetical protein